MYVHHPTRLMLDHAARLQVVYGFEFGNELPKVDPNVDGRDFLTLHGLLVKHWPNVSQRPRLIGNDLNTNPSYVGDWLKVAGPVMDVITFHGYVRTSAVLPRTGRDCVPVTHFGTKHLHSQKEVQGGGAGRGRCVCSGEGWGLLKEEKGAMRFC